MSSNSQLQSNYLAKEQLRAAPLVNKEQLRTYK